MRWLWLVLPIFAACSRKEDPKAPPAPPPTHIGPVPSPAIIDRARQELNKLPKPVYPGDEPEKKD